MNSNNLMYITEETKDYILNFYKPARKTAKTLLRLANDEEIGHHFETFVEKNGTKVLESIDIINNTEVISRNPNPLSDGSFNDFIMPKSLFFEHYGEDQYNKLTTEFQPMSKIITANVIEITPELKNKLRDYVQDGFITFKAIFDLVMKVDIGDILVVNLDKNIFEYGIDRMQFDNTYEYLNVTNKKKMKM